MNTYINEDEKKDYIWYAEVFEKTMREGRDIFNYKGDRLEILEDEEFRQCYSPDDIRRRVLPYSWFISNKSGNCISVKSNGELIWLTKLNADKNYGEYIFVHPVTRKSKTIKIHNLVGLVYGAKEFGKAKEMLDSKELYAFGDRAEKDNINGHHIKKVNDYPEEKYNSDNIEFLTVRAHDIINSFPKENASEQQKMEFVKRLNELAAEEVPNKIVVVTGGEEKAIQAFDSININMSKEDFCILLGTINGYKKLMSLDENLRLKERNHDKSE